MTRIFGISLLIIISFAKEYYISFRFVSFNSVLYYENFNCSAAIKKHPCKKKLSFVISGVDEKFRCGDYSDKIIKKLLKKEVIIRSIDEINNIYTFKTILTFTPRLYDIIIKDNVAYFYECKE